MAKYELSVSAVFLTAHEKNDAGVASSSIIVISNILSVQFQVTSSIQPKSHESLNWIVCGDHHGVHPEDGVKSSQAVHAAFILIDWLAHGDNAINTSAEFAAQILLAAMDVSHVPH